MPEPMPGREWFHVHDDASKVLMRAIAETFDKFDAAGRKPAGEFWMTYDEKFREVYDEVVSRWARVKDYEPYRFPFNVGTVKEGWLSYRKATAEQRSHIRRWACGTGNDSQPSLFENMES